MELNNPYMHSSFYIPPRPPQQHTPAARAAAFENLAQSADKIHLFEVPLDMRIFAVWPLRPDRVGGCADMINHHITARVASLVLIHNPADKMCMLRAVCVGIATIRYEKGDITPQRYRAFIIRGSVSGHIF